MNEHKPSYDEMQNRLTELEDIVAALQNEEVDAVVGNDNLLLIRLKETEDKLAEQRHQLEQIVRERTELIEKLKIHQVELETQGEELLSAQRGVMESRDKYLDLYDFAPIGYLTLDKDGIILEANMTAAALMGTERKYLIHSKFTKFINPDSQDALYFYLKQVKENGRYKGEISLRRINGSVIYVRLDSVVVHSGGTETIRIALSDISESKKTEAELQQYREHLEDLVEDRTNELREATRRVFDLQEKERRELARELHDQTGQYLTALRLMLGRVKKTPPAEAASLVDEANGLVGELVKQVRSMSLNLRPSMLDDMGLLHTLIWHFENYQKQTGIEVSFSHDGLPEKIGSEINTVAYRIIQEALTNVAKYAGVKRVEVRIKSNSELVISIRDEGTGFVVREGLAKESNGLSGMRERAFLVGGKLSIESSPGTGTTVEAILPLTPKKIT